jgi:hypothetical protein
VDTRPNLNLDRIDFISEYCDRWCERCAFTSRCSAYAVQIATAMCEGPSMADSSEFFNAVAAYYRVSSTNRRRHTTYEKRASAYTHACFPEASVVEIRL